MARQGTIREVRPCLKDGRLKVVARVSTEEEGFKEAFLPDREVAALLPRSLLAGSCREVPDSLLDTLRPILHRLAAGREVRLWEYHERLYCSFPSWRGVRFEQEQPGKPVLEENAAGHGHVQ